MTFNNKESISATCLKFNAQAVDFQNMINTLGFDFNGDGMVTAADANHITVSRHGDGGVLSGYGYTYKLLFSGPPLTFGSSLVLGDSQPSLEILDEGHYGGCRDLNVTSIGSIQSTTINGTSYNGIAINYAASVGKITWTSLTTTLGYVQAGDKLRLPTSASPYILYTVTSTTEFTITVDTPLIAFTGSVGALFEMGIIVITGILPEYSVRTSVQGEDSYTYAIYFSGPHLADAYQLSPISCTPASTVGSVVTPGYSQYGGMLTGVSVETIHDGGSNEVQTLTFNSRSYITVVSNNWKLVLSGGTILGEIVCLTCLFSCFYF